MTGLAYIQIYNSASGSFFENKKLGVEAVKFFNENRLKFNNTVEIDKLLTNRISIGKNSSGDAKYSVNVGINNSSILTKTGLANFYGPVNFGLLNSSTDSTRAYNIGGQNAIVDSDQTMIFGINNQYSGIVRSYTLGANNIIESGTENVIIGRDNALRNDNQTSLILGFYNQNIEKNKSSLIIGNSNTEILNSNNINLIGNYNSIFGSKNTIIFGEANSVVSNDSSYVYGGNNNITTGYQDVVFGKSNILASGISNLVFGLGNSSSYGNSENIFGRSNSSIGNLNFINGIQNTVKSKYSEENEVLGRLNILNKASNNIIVGKSNRSSEDAYLNLYGTGLGQSFIDEQVSGAVYAGIFGNQNYTSRSFYSYIFGNNNIVDFNLNGYTIGENNRVMLSQGSYIFGKGNQLSGKNNFLIGFNNTIRSGDSDVIVIGQYYTAKDDFEKNKIIINYQNNRIEVINTGIKLTSSTSPTINGDKILTTPDLISIENSINDQRIANTINYFSLTGELYTNPLNLYDTKIDHLANKVNLISGGYTHTILDSVALQFDISGVTGMGLTTGKLSFKIPSNTIFTRARKSLDYSGLFNISEIYYQNKNYNLGVFHDKNSKQWLVGDLNSDQYYFFSTQSNPNIFGGSSGQIGNLQQELGATRFRATGTYAGAAGITYYSGMESTTNGKKYGPLFVYNTKEISVNQIYTSIELPKNLGDFSYVPSTVYESEDNNFNLFFGKPYVLTSGFKKMNQNNQYVDYQWLIVNNLLSNRSGELYFGDNLSSTSQTTDYSFKINGTNLAYTGFGNGRTPAITLRMDGSRYSLVKSYVPNYGQVYFPFYY
jgi:hypothetical protein